MSWRKREAEKSKFNFYMTLLVGVLVLFVIIDIMMVPSIFFGSNSTVNIPIIDVNMWPYHFWIMGVLFYSMVTIVAVSYWKHTSNKKGAIVIMIIGAIFSLFLVEDFLYFALQGQAQPDIWTWLYYSPVAGGAPITGDAVTVVALTGIAFCLILYYSYIKRKRLD